MEYYNFNTKNVNAQSLIHVINLTQGDDIVGIELGVGHGESLCTLAQQCPSIKTLYGVDPFTPYLDFHKEVYDGQPYDIKDDKSADIARRICEHNIKFSGMEDKINLITQPAENMLETIKDESIDFIFMDAYSLKEDYYRAMEDWYPKIKKGGIFSGHDYKFEYIQNLVYNFRINYSVTSKISVYDNLWVWIK
jgi:hypothetical protein